MLIIICVLLLANTLFIYYGERHISIALINSAMWTILSAAVLFFNMPATQKAYAFVLINTIGFSFSYMITKGRIDISVRKSDKHYQKTAKSGYAVVYDESVYNRLIKRIIVLNVISVLYLAYSLGFRLSTFTSIVRLMSRMNAISSMRYTGDAAPIPIFNRLVNAIVYASCSFSGFYMAYKPRGIHLVNIGLIVFQTIILNTKATLVFGLAFWVGGYLTSLSYQKKEISAGKVFAALGALVCILVFSAGINYFRHRGRVPYYSEFNRILNAYFIGPFSAFSMWFDTADRSTLDLGANTFSCVFRIFGIRAQEHGTGIQLTDTAGTNVYTVFKHLVSDYSTFGTILISIMLGFTIGIIDTKLRKGRSASINISMVFCSVILVAFFSSLFRYTTNLMACLFIIAMPTLKRVRVGGKRIL